MGERSKEEGLEISSDLTNRNNCSTSSSTRAKYNARVVSQTLIDAKLHVNFEESERLFDYSTSVDLNVSGSTSNVSSSSVSAYLQSIQRGTLIQPFGCLITVDEQNFTVLAYSENVPEMLGLTPHAVPSIGQQDALTFETDVRTLFQSAGSAALQKATNFAEINLLNPLLLHCKASGKPFYAILHRIDVGLVIDLEPVNPADVPVTAAGALRSYKLAAKAISRLQALPSRNISLLCDVLVKEVRDLTGYDRVMVYKFHEDDHGEVIAEYHRSDLEPYLGLHYPATDIPQASRFLFMKNKVRMIYDCSASSVKVVQDKRLLQPISLCGSTLRAPHGCHAQYMANMGSVASLVMSVTINKDDDVADGDQQRGRRLWGLVVCHHTNPRFVSFPLRYACEFLLQVFGVQINKEVELAAQTKEKLILQTQTVLCNMLLRDAPVGIVTQSPNVMDLVKCDGAALYYREKFWLLGVTPTEPQIKDIAEWLLEHHGGNTGLSTDSLVEAGYPGAAFLGESICGMAAVKITSKDFLFWFRSITAKEIKWGGAKHDPEDKGNGRKMHPRSSFKAFLEVVKWKSMPWEDVEMDTIHSLQLILRGSLQDEAVDDSEMVVNVPLVDNRIQKVDELCIVTNEMVRLIETAAVPILAVDASGAINGWNSKAAELTGIALEQAIGRPLLELVEEHSIEIVKNMFLLALQGTEERGVEISLKTFGPQENNGPLVLVVSVCCSRDMTEAVLGVCFVGQDVTRQKMLMENYTRVQGDYTGIMRTPSPLIPPIFMTDANGLCSEWNNAMQKMSGLKKEDAVNKILLGEVFTVSNYGFHLKDHETLTKLRIALNAVIAGQDTEKLLFGFFDHQGNLVEAILSANKKTDAEGNVTGVLCFVQLPSPELQHALQVQKMSEQAVASTLNKLAYIRHEIRNPLNAISFIQDYLGSSDLEEDNKRLLRTSVLCLEQLTKIVNDTDIENIDEGYAELSSGKFNLGEALEAVVKQAMIPSQEHHVQIICDFPDEASTMQLYGDNLRLQQVLSDFLLNAIRFTLTSGGSSIPFKVILQKERIGKRVQIVHVEFRITHAAPGLPDDLVQEMFHHSQGVSKEGLSLYISQKLVRLMNGTVSYLREAERSSFIILVEFPMVFKSGSS